MAELEEPQFTSLSQRIAALNQSQSSQTTTFGKRPPPPIPTSTNRPPIQPRGQTTNNPPIATYGSSVSKQANNQPLGVKGNILPPPPVDRDSLPQKTANARSSPLPTRNAPPPLPGRKESPVSPALPPRKASTQLARRGSNSSMLSISSTVSGMSLGQGSTTTSASSVDTQTGRKLPPPLDQAKLPPLPPSRREKEELAKANKVPLVTTRSTPNIVLREPPVVERDVAPKMPPRPSLPARPVSRNYKTEEAPPVQPPRRLPPPAAATRNILSMGFKNKSEPRKQTETPNPAPRPTPTYNPSPTGPVVLELTDRNFDSIVMSGKPSIVDFYAPYCKYCKELDPIWQELGQNFAFASDRLVIAKLDVNDYKSFLSRFNIEGYPTIMYFDGKSEIPENYPYMRELAPLTEYLEGKTGINVEDGARKPGLPPPIPLSTRPKINMSTRPSTVPVKGTQSRPAPSAGPLSGCLICRDFTGPDEVSAQYPRQSLPHNGDQIAYLAEVLCGPFESPTDKARAIFTWLHHNIAYDTVAFFGNNVKNVAPNDTIRTGLAVCGGYAGLYVAIALKAGLECVMVSGDGKGFGTSPLKAGEPIPPRNPTGHAWNAVRIDRGEWKLIDACWGAGHISQEGYTKRFTPSFFTMSNDEFGLKHFPADDAYFFRSDGGVEMWDNYMIGPVGAEPLQLYSIIDEHGLSPTSFSPPQKHIPVNSNEVIRFQFSKVCEHYDHVKNGNGLPYQMILHINGLDGRKEDYVAFEKNDFWWWCDVKARDLGAPGQTVSCYTVTVVQGKDARGLSRNEYLQKKGKVAMGPFGGICSWNLV
jgi:protein disulfide-isomerase-like protein